jgi:hypothetical protein
MLMSRSIRLLTALIVLLLGTAPRALGHGSVSADDDLCLIEIGYFTAHFKIYLPRTRQHQEFCEDLPDAGEAVFVMDYIHGDLETVAMDFRIIRNVTGLGRFASLEDVKKIEDLEGATVFYRPAAVQADVYTALHHFQEPGEYLGIVTARHGESDQVYAAVFPFQVGYFEFGYLPLFLILVALVQLGYWSMNHKQLPRVLAGIGSRRRRP